MKKRLLVLAIMVLAVVTVFAISVSAEAVLNEGNALKTSTSDEFATGDQINYITGLANEIYFNGTSSQGNKKLSLDQRMVLKNDDGTYSTFPSAYLFDISKDNNKRAHRFQWLDVTLINEATGQTYEPADLIRLEIPEGIIDIHHDDRSSNARLGMQNSTDLKAENLKYISFPSTGSTITMGDFARGIKALEEVDFSKMTNPYNFSMGTAFYECTSLSKVTFPETFNSDNGSIGSCAINENMFYNNTALTSISLPKEISSIGKYAFKKSGLVSVDLSHLTKLTTIQQDAFRECASLKTIKMPPNLSAIDAEAFRDCTSLEFVDFSNNVAETFKCSAHRTFYNCGELRALSLPAGTQYLNNGTFALCKKLEAFYIGNSIIQINGNKGDGAGDGPTFAECEKMYFVNEPFKVTKEDGTFYTVEEFEEIMPEKPDVYYFPSTLTRICGAHNVNSSFTMDENGHVKNVGAGDLAFVKCYNLNKYLVFPEGFTGVDENIRSGNDATENPDHRGDTLGTGLFHYCGTADNPITLVFMGQIHRLSFDKRNGQTSYLTYMFANPANTGFENTQIASYIGDSHYSNQNEMYVVFCHAPNGAERYQISFVGSETDKNVPVLTPSLVVENSVTHVENPKLQPVVTPATCLTNEARLVYCFCGKEAGRVEVENSALGHEFDVADGATYLGIVYENGYMKAGAHKYDCARCDVIDDSNTVEALFVWRGYSCTEQAIGGKHSVEQSYYVNKQAIEAYVGHTVEFGLVASAIANPLDPSNSQFVQSGKIIVADQTAFNYDYINIKIAGISAETMIDTPLVFCAYIKDNENVYYLDNGETSDTANGISYSDVLEMKGGVA